MHSPKPVQKIGLFRLQTLLTDFKRIYPIYMDVFIQAEDEIKQLILGDSPTEQG